MRYRAKSSSSVKSRVMLRARRFEQLGATTGLEAIPDLNAIEAVPMLSTAVELLPPAAQAAA